MWVFLGFLAWPLIEIGLFVEIGGAIGLWPTLAWVLLSAALGIFVLRSQGQEAALQLRGGMRGMDPLSPLAHGVLKGLAGMLLILPGFLTDAIGLLLLLPPVRLALVAMLARRVKAHVAGKDFAQGSVWPEHGRDPRQPAILEGEYHEIDPDAEMQDDRHPGPDGPRRPSGWTRH
jgi:UPF0716 protein FxsA